MNTKTIRSKKTEDLFIRLSWFVSGTIVGLVLLSIGKAAVPKKSKFQITDDTALYQGLSEIRVERPPVLHFDAEIANLARSESLFKEKLPLKKTSYASRSKKIKSRR